MAEKDKPQALTLDAASPHRFGAFGGVFTPSVLTILGVIMFLRTGWVVGQAGLRDALLILGIANGITLLTALSLSAISTNTHVGAGGAYYLISRSLGLEVGGSIGLPLFLAQAISVAFYIIGFTDSISIFFEAAGIDPTHWLNLAPAAVQPHLAHLDQRALSLGVLAVFFVLAWRGADIVLKTQYLIMACLGLALVSFFLGAAPVGDMRENLAANWQPRYQADLSFWLVFAIFFPAVTGMDAGLSMSGDLREPSKAIPRGAILAVLVTMGVYLAQMVFLATNADRTLLLESPLVMRDIALVGAAIYVGIWAATLSSALASMMAAPRTLQALAVDCVVPRWLGRGRGPAHEPRIALVFTALLAAGCVWLGELNLIAPIISMFFLASYGMINLVAGLERLVSNPSYRPSFRVHWVWSLAGAGGCALAMFLIHPLATVAAILVIVLVYLGMTRRKFHTAWGDMRSGMWFALARLGLLRLAASRQHVRNWRPVLLVLVGNPQQRARMVDFANYIEARKGLLFLAQVVPGEWEKMLSRQEAFEQSLNQFIHDQRLSAVAKTVVAESFEEGVAILLQVAGLGALEPNTVMIGWSEDVLRKAGFTRALRRIIQLKRNLVVYEEAKLTSAQLEPTIDVWWRARENGSLMVTLAHLIHSHVRFREHRIRVRRIVSNEAGREETAASMRKLLDELRLQAQVDVIVSQLPPLTVIGIKSANSELTFVGLDIKPPSADALSAPVPRGPTSEADAADETSPLDPYSRLISELQGHVFVTKSWQEIVH